MLTIRRLLDDELTGVYDIDMTESGDIVYVVVENHLEAVAEQWDRPPRTRARWDEMIAYWRGILDEGGAAWGAFDGAQMVGIAVLRYRLTNDTAELTALFVSRPYRRAGVARRLMSPLVAEAKEVGAARLYVSATPSRSAVGFYQSQGFQLAEQVHPGLYAREPDDIHMVRPLG